MKESTKETRINLITRICKMNMLFQIEYFEDLKKAEEEQKQAEELKKSESDDIQVMLMTGDWNAKVSLDCMKSCAEVCDYLREEKNELYEWQAKAITAMIDQAKEDESYPYDMPQAISDILGIRFMKK